MPVTDVLDIYVCLGSFVNLELLRKGLYRVAVSISSKAGGPAIPYLHHSAPSRLTSVSRKIVCDGSDLGVEPAFIQETSGPAPGLGGNAGGAAAGGKGSGSGSGSSGAAAGAAGGNKYYSRSVFCRYVDEDFDLSEGVSFRLELPRTVRPESYYSAAGTAASVSSSTLSTQEGLSSSSSSAISDSALIDGALASSSSALQPQPQQQPPAAGPSIVLLVELLRADFDESGGNVKRRGLFSVISSR